MKDESLKRKISVINPGDSTSMRYEINLEHSNLFLMKPSDGQYHNNHLDFSKVDKMMAYLGYNQSEIADLLDIDNSTVSRWKKKDSKLDRYRSAYLYKIDNLLATGNRIFGNLEDLQHWLYTENLALGNKKPVEAIKTNGVDKVIGILHSLSWGNYL